MSHVMSLAPTTSNYTQTLFRMFTNMNTDTFISGKKNIVDSYT